MSTTPPPYITFSPSSDQKEGHVVSAHGRHYEIVCIGIIGSSEWARATLVDNAEPDMSRVYEGKIDGSAVLFDMLGKRYAPLPRWHEIMRTDSGIVGVVDLDTSQPFALAWLPIPSTARITDLYIRDSRQSGL